MSCLQTPKMTPALGFTVEPGDVSSYRFRIPAGPTHVTLAQKREILLNYS